MKILSTQYSCSRAYLLADYHKLLIRSVVHHKLYSGKNKSSTAKVLYEKVSGFTVHFFSYAQVIDLFEEIFIFQAYASDHACPAPVIIDCGGNIGLSVLFFKKQYPLSIVMAFEPDKETFILLEKNIRDNNLSHVSLFNYALSNVEGVAALYKNNTISGSLTMSLVQSPDKPKIEMVQTRRLSTYIHGTVHTLKIDVEGSETEIINDLAESARLQLIEKIIIEYHPKITGVSPEEFISRIEECGFSCKPVANLLHAGSVDVLIYCTRRKVA